MSLKKFYILNIVLLITNLYLGKICFDLFERVKQNKIIDQIKPTSIDIDRLGFKVNDFKLTNFDTSFDKLYEIFDYIEQNATDANIEFTKRESYLLGKKYNKKYYYNQSFYILNGSYLDLISTIQKLIKEKLIFNIAEMNIDAQPDQNPIITLKTITLAYETH